MKVDEKIEQLIAEELDVSRDKIVDSADFLYDLGASLDVVELFMRCEEEFGIEIPDEAELYMVGALKNWVRQALKNKSLLTGEHEL